MNALGNNLGGPWTVAWNHFGVSIGLGRDQCAVSLQCTSNCCSHTSYSSIGALRGLCRGSMGDMGKIMDLGSGGVWGAIFIVSFNERVAQKLRVTFRVPLDKIRRILISMIFGLGRRDPDSQNKLLSTWDPPNYFNEYKKSLKFFER